MTPPLKCVSAFAGVGGFDKGFERAGIDVVAQIEWDKNKTKVLAEHWPNVPRMGDITEVSGSDLGTGINIFAGGFPCQGVAARVQGGGAGLADPRSAHFFSFTRLVDEYARLIDAHNPRWVVVENVPGLLTSNDGHDMDAVIGTMASLSYGLAWRIVDSGIGFGVPQQRLRLILVGHRGGDPRPAAQVLHHTELGSGDPRTDQPKGRPSRPAAGASAEDHVGRVIFRKSRRAQKASKYDAAGNLTFEGDFETWVEDTYSNCLTAFDVGDVRATQLIVDGDRLRRLTPEEWECLFGFERGWTAAMPEGRRQPALGEAVTVPMCEWLGRRIQFVDAALPLHPAIA